MRMKSSHPVQLLPPLPPPSPSTLLLSPVVCLKAPTNPHSFEGFVGSRGDPHLTPVYHEPSFSVPYHSIVQQVS